MTVQDDERERELVRLFNLEWDPAHQRSGVDAVLRIGTGSSAVAIDVEVKSSTTDTVSTARDVGMAHIEKWRRQLFVIGFYSRDARRPELLRCLCLTPQDLALWVDSIQQKVEIDFRIAERASKALSLADLHAVCEERSSYTLADAQQVLRQQRTAAQYKAAADLQVGDEKRLSPQAMLQVLQARAVYIAQRGATLNNPHIPRALLQQFVGTDREVRGDWAARIRQIAGDWLARQA
jgi:hypothetical protein